MKVTFWGVRGTFPATGPRYVRYGGDTMCIEVDCGGNILVLDAGTGLRMLGEKLRARSGPAHVSLLLSHAHIDHLLGFVQFAPLWRADTQLTVWSPQALGDDAGLAVRTLLSPPFTPEGAADFPAKIEWRSLKALELIEAAPGVRVTAFLVNHPGGAFGYRIDHAGRTLVYITDHEHGDRTQDDRLAWIARNADLLIYDATFTEEEMASRRGWGHSTWPAGMRLRDKAGGKLVAFAHHDPMRSDDDLDRLAHEAARAGTNAFFAREGLTIDL